MTTFYICRHGETGNNKRQRFLGWLDSPLTEQGERDAASLASKLQSVHYDKIISSDLGRSFVTAYLIARQLGYQDEIERHEGLREINYGDYGGRPYSEYPDMTPEQNATYVPPNGESLIQMQKRVLTTLQILSEANEGKSVIIVAHDGTINAVRASFTNEPMGEADQVHNPHDYAAKVEWDNGHVTAFDEVTTK